MIFNLTMKRIICAIVSKSLSPPLPPPPCSSHGLLWIPGCVCTVLVSPHTILENRHHYNYPHLRVEATEVQSGTQYKMPDLGLELGSVWVQNKLSTTILISLYCCHKYCCQGQHSRYPLWQHHQVTQHHLFDHFQYHHLNQDYC